MERKKIMVLGASRGQVNLINLLHKYNCYVIGVSPKGNYAGISLVDEMAYLDVRDAKGILDYARQNQVEGILTDQLDEAVFSVAYVAENLGLKGIGTKTAEKFTNKFTMREFAKIAGINVPKSVCIQCKEQIKEKIKDLGFPLMVKPLDSSASRGIFKANSLEDILNNYEYCVSYSKSKQVIIEQFIEGEEYVVQAFTHNKKTNNLIIGKRGYFNIEGTFIPNQTLFVDAGSANSLQKRILRENDKLIKSFDLNFGITHSEWLYNAKEDKIYLVEIAARGGGVFTSSHIIPKASGVNANELLVKEVLGLEILDSEFKTTRGSSAYLCYLLPKGTIRTIKGIDDVLSLDGVDTAFFDNVSEGMEIISNLDKSSRKGPIIIFGKSPNECYQTIEKIKAVLQIEVETEEGLKPIIWQ